MSEIIDSPKAALCYLDFLVTFGTDPGMIAQMRGMRRVIKTLMRQAEKNSLENERREARMAAAVAAVGAVDVVDVLRGVYSAIGGGTSPLATVCKQAADEIESLRWALKDCTT